MYVMSPDKRPWLPDTHGARPVGNVARCIALIRSWQSLALTDQVARVWVAAFVTTIRAKCSDLMLYATAG